MRNGKGDPGQRLSEWLDKLERFDLPDWDSLPQLDLYMDQVILLLTRYLSPLERYGEEKAITASIINNYVRMKVMPPPVKKRYSRVHLAYLGRPILGDAVYGKPAPGLQGQCLHAAGLRFVHPRTGEAVELRCPLPEEFQAQLRRLAARV